MTLKVSRDLRTQICRARKRSRLAQLFVPFWESVNSPNPFASLDFSGEEENSLPSSYSSHSARFSGAERPPAPHPVRDTKRAGHHWPAKDPRPSRVRREHVAVDPANMALRAGYSLDFVTSAERQRRWRPKRAPGPSAWTRLLWSSRSIVDDIDIPFDRDTYRLLRKRRRISRRESRRARGDNLVSLSKLAWKELKCQKLDTFGPPKWLVALYGLEKVFYKTFNQWSNIDKLATLYVRLSWLDTAMTGVGTVKAPFDSWAHPDYHSLPFNWKRGLAVYCKSVIPDVLSHPVDRRSSTGRNKGPAHAKCSSPCGSSSYDEDVSVLTDW